MTCSTNNVLVVACLLGLALGGVGKRAADSDKNSMDGTTTFEKMDNGTVTQGASGLEMKSDDSVGEDMFEMSGDDSTESDSTFTFGFAKIVEISSNGTMINATNHMCNFRKHNVTCTTGDEEIGSLEAVDSYGNSTTANYTMVARTCDLSGCNSNSNATLIVRSYIMMNKAYICQPNCTYEDQYQSPVFNGTAKWEIEIKDWDFCNNGTDDCDGEVADKLKVFFSMGGKEGGKEMKPKKKDMKPFDMEEGKFGEMCGGNSTDSKDDKDDKDKDDKEKSPKVESAGNGTGNGTSNGNGTSHENGKGDMREEMGNREGYGKCRNSMSSSFGDEPDDQESFSFSDDDDTSNSSSTFRMFGMAVVDNDTVVSNGTGFDGPNMETEEIGEGEEKKTKEYITICVSKFNKSMVYDPTYDIDSSGGTTGDDGDEPVVIGSGARAAGSVVMISVAMAAILNFLN